MKVFHLPLIVIALFLQTTTWAQTPTQTQTGWFLSLNTIKLGAKTSLHAEFQLRSSDDFAATQSLITRVGLNYQTGQRTVLTGGYAYILNRMGAGGVHELLPEHRLWQQLVIHQPVVTTSLMHRFRLEERWIPKTIMDNGNLEIDERLFSMRLRYFARMIVPLQKAKSFSKGMFLTLQDEVFANVVNSVNVNGKIFDQNRAYIALGYRLSKKCDIELGYLNQFISTKEPSPNVMNHAFQLAVYSRL
ncbi:MAG TPA: DUF2490 domain-containing protein [Phnomibacter sp.]|nr:DUF2490 domain-containing protein [Phnomibacter sp.]